jgi:hypothetical protein
MVRTFGGGADRARREDPEQPLTDDMVRRVACMGSFGSTGWVSTRLALEAEEQGPAWNVAPIILRKGGQVTDSTVVRVFTTLRSRLQDPAVLVIIAVVFLISAVGQAILQALVGDHSVVITAVLSVLGSVFLAAAIIVASRRDR